MSSKPGNNCFEHFKFSKVLKHECFISDIIMCLWSDSCSELPISVCVCEQSEVDEDSDTSTTPETVEGSARTQHTEARQRLNTGRICVMPALRLKYNSEQEYSKCFHFSADEYELNQISVAFFSKYFSL